MANNNYKSETVYQPVMGGSVGKQFVSSLTGFMGGESITTDSHELPNAVFHHMVDQSSTAISITDQKANIIYANEAFAEVTGYDRDEVLGKNESVLSDKHTPRSVYEALWGTLKRGKSWCGLLVNRRKDGTRYLAEVTITPIKSEHGEVTNYLGIHRDVSEFHQLQRTVMNQKALIESVIDAVPMAIVLLDKDNKVILDNHAYKTLQSSFKNKEPAEIFSIALNEKMGEKFTKFKQQKASFENEEIVIDQGGDRDTRWFSCSGSWVEVKDESVVGFFESEHKKYLLMIAMETTSLKRQQEELRRIAMRELIVEEEWVQAMRETLAGAIYQFQKPVNLIAAATGILERRVDQKENNTALINVLQQALSSGKTSLTTLRNSMPERKESSRSPVNLNQVIRDVLSISTERLISEGVIVDWKPALILPRFIGSEPQLQSVMKHLIDNAIEAMSSNRGSRDLAITTDSDDAYIYVTISDNGPGIPEDMRSRIFEPFYTTKPGKKHAGMGLSSVQEIINEHAGNMSILPGSDSGCSIRLSFPQVKVD